MSDHIWDAPQEYSPMQDDPPYLKTAGLKVSNDVLNSQANLVAILLDAYGYAKGAEIAAVLVYLRALVWLHQTHHWQTNGSAFYGDHLLFDRLYSNVQAEVDSTAEKALGIGSSLSLVDPKVQASQMANILRVLEPPITDATGYVASSLRAELYFATFLQLVYRKLEAEQKLSLGLDNFLQGLADKHEENLYLLQQRMSMRQASRKTADKKVRLDPKELQRASNGYTIIVRPQADSTYMVAAVKIDGNVGILMGKPYLQYTNNENGIQQAVADVNRWLDKMGVAVPMADASRTRQKHWWKA